MVYFMVYFCDGLLNSVLMLVAITGSYPFKGLYFTPHPTPTLLSYAMSMSYVCEWENGCGLSSIRELRMKVSGPGLVLFLFHLVFVHTSSEYLNEEPVSSRYS